MDRAWSRRRLIATGLGLGAGLALGGSLDAQRRASQPTTSTSGSILATARLTSAPVASASASTSTRWTWRCASSRCWKGPGCGSRMTRTEHVALSPMSHPDPTERIRIEQAARIAAVGNARIYVSLHFDGVDSPSVRGTQTFYNAEQHGDEGRRLAEAIQRSMVAEIRATGVSDRSTVAPPRICRPASRTATSSCCAARCRASAASRCSSPTRPRAELMLQEETRQAVARGYAGGIVAYFAGG